MIARSAWAATSLLALLGCGGAAENARFGQTVETPTTEAAQDAAAGTVPAISRKIIYTAEVELIVDDFAGVAERIEGLVQQEGGYLSRADVRAAPTAPRRGSWTARIPVDRFGPFLEAVAGLGELRRRQTDARDVTEEYVDLEARIKNKRLEESRLLRLLDEQTGALKDVLDVERELSRVREEIERQQGRLQYLANQTAMTTVEIEVDERGRYLPMEHPAFGTRLGRTFRASVDLLIAFGEGLVILAVGAIPWALALILLGLPLWFLIRRRIRRGFIVNDRPPSI